MKPFINIVIPTRERAEPLYWTIKSCLLQDYSDYKIVVSDNDSKDNTAEVVNTFSDDRIEYIKTPQRLSMSENWEFALNYIEDGYVIFLGDDDGLVPNSLSTVASLFEQTGATALRTHNIVYYWPNIVDRNSAGMLYNLPLRKDFEWINSKQILHGVSENLEYYHPYFLDMPTVYQSFVSIELIKGIQRRDEGFFLSAYPDMYSAVMIAAEIDRYILLHQPVSINAMSRFSNGVANNNYFEKESKEIQAFFSESAFPYDQLFVAPGTEIKKFLTHPIMIADQLVKARRKNVSIPAVDLKNVIRRSVVSAQKRQRREHFEAVLEDVRRVARINNLESYAEDLIDKIFFKESKNSRPKFSVNGNNRTCTIDTLVYGVNNVFEAGLLINNIMCQNDIRTTIGNEENLPKHMFALNADKDEENDLDIIRESKSTEVYYNNKRNLSEHHSNDVSEYQEYLNPTLSIENMDKYLVRTGILNSVKKVLPLFQGTLLDIGCGEMPYKQLLTSIPGKVKRYIGMDIENPDYQKNVKPDLFWDGQKIPLYDSSVECVVATEVLEHLPDIQSVVKELYRVLKPGGLLFFTVPFLWNLHDVPNDEYRYTPFSLKRIFKNAGFDDDIEISALGGWNAALAQMLGLWIRRAPMAEEQRNKFAESFWNLYNELIRTDVKPAEFKEGTMVTGLAGTIRKQQSKDLVNGSEIEIVNDINSKEKTLAIFTPNFGAVSETFIKKHIEYLMPGKTVVVTGNILDNGWINVPFLQIPYGEGPQKYPTEVENKVENFLNENKVTHILVEYGCYGTSIVELNSRKLHYPIYVHFHGGDAAAMLRRKEMVEYYRWMGQQVTGVIAVAKPMAERLINIGIPKDKIFINHYGVEILEHIEAQPEKSPCRFIFVGRLVPKKGPGITLTAFAKAYQRVENIHLDIIGDFLPPDQNVSIKMKLEEIAEKYSLQNAVTFHGAKSNEYVKDILKQSCVYVQHSITVPETGDAEGLPNSILEASAYGLPVISTFHEGIPEEVEHQRTGFLVNEFDTDAMAEYMIKLADNPNLRKTMGLEGRRKIQNEFPLEKSIQSLREIIFSKPDNQDSQNLSSVRKSSGNAFPKLSFIIIVLNGMPFIEYALRAVYNFAHEIIIVEGAVEKCLFAANSDGSSKDGTVEFINNFDDPEGKIRMIQGIWPEKLDMQNKALDYVTGDYIWLVDSDEIYKKDDIESVIKMLRNDSSITQINFIGDNFWKGFDYIFVSRFFFEKSAHFRRVFKFRKGARFVSHRPPTFLLPGINKTTEEIHLIDGTTTRKMGIYPYHYSYVLEEQVKQKVELYNRYNWGKMWEIDMDLWFKECYLKWSPDNRKEIEAEYPVWTGDKNSHTELFQGEHPEVLKNLIESTKGEKGDDIRDSEKNITLHDNTLSVRPGVTKRYPSILVPQDQMNNLRPESLVPNEYIQVLYYCISEAIKVNGDIIEVGVYKGGSLFRMAEFIAKNHRLNFANRCLIGIDTFSGHPYADPNIDPAHHYIGRFSDTSYDRVKGIFEAFNFVNIVKGECGESFKKFPEDQQFCLANIDVDIAQSAIESINYIYPRLSAGGIIIFDEYQGYGQEKFINEFFKNKPVKLIPRTGMKGNNYGLIAIKLKEGTAVDGAGRRNSSAENSSKKSIKIAGKDEKEKDLTEVDSHSAFSDSIFKIFGEIKPKKIIETGTYLGNGTTKIIASAIKEFSQENVEFYSIEINPVNIKQAELNLNNEGLLRYVKLLNGVSIPRVLLPTFSEIKNSTIDNIEFENIFVDHNESERAELYYKETDFKNVPDDMLGKCLKKFEYKPDFVLLDSGGHVGYVEFKYLIESLQGECYVALDDIYHIKHHKSFLHLQSDPRFEIITSSAEKFGFCIAKFTPVRSKMPTVNDADVKKIIFLRTDSIGDSILASSLLEPLKTKYFNSSLIVICQAHVGELYESNPYIDEIIKIDFNKYYRDQAYQNNIFYRLNSINADLLINSVYSRTNLCDEIARKCSAGIKLAFAGNTNNISFDDLARNNSIYSQLICTGNNVDNELGRYIKLLEFLGIQVNEITPNIRILNEDIEFANDVFKEFRLSGDKTICLAPYAQYEVRNYFGYKKITEELKGFNFIILGAAIDYMRALKEYGSNNSNVINLTGKTTIRQMAALIKKARVFIGAESAGAHIACAVGTPNVVITGGGHFGRFVPYSSLTSLVTLPVSCYGCNWKCKHEKAYCIKDIDPGLVGKAVENILSRKNIKPRIYFNEIKNNENHDTILGLLSGFVDLNNIEIIEVKENKVLSVTEHAHYTDTVSAETNRLPHSLKISVITPSYNQGKFLEGTIKSVLSQNYPNFEHIIIDGGSTDETIEILKKYPHLIWVSEKDYGQADALNKGFKKATGDIIAWINSDDWYEPDTFNSVAEYFEKNPDRNVVMGNCNLVDQDGKIFDRVVNYERGFDELKNYKISRSIPTQPAIFFRKKLLNEFGLLDVNLKYVMDYDLWMRFAKINRFYHINRTFASYRFHKDAKIGDSNWEKIFPECEIVRKRYVAASEDPLISVIIPCYNYGRYLPESVESVVNQTYKNLEIIIVNDGSTDNTKEVAERLIKKFPDNRIKLLNLANSGKPAVSRNNGISEASGDYILPLDADDKIDPQMLTECVRVLQSGPPNRIIYTARQDFDGSNSLVMPPEYDFERLKKENHMSYCALFPREMWEKIGGYRENVGMEDWDFWIAAGLRGYFGTLIPKPLFFYRCHGLGQYQRDVKNIQPILATIIKNNEEAYTKKENILAGKYLKMIKEANRVTVIIPTYNRPDKLKTALDSVINQSFQNFEIIVVNDAGQEVKNIIAGFNDCRIKHIEHKINKGLAAARNTGLKNATGIYIAYLDDDDIFYPDHLETLVSFLENSDYKIAYTDAYRATQEFQNGNYVTIKKEVPFSNDYSKDKLLELNIAPVLCFMHEKSCIEETGLFDETLKAHEDWDFWIRLSSKYEFAHIKKITSEFTYRTDKSNMTGSQNLDFYNSYRDIIAKYYNLSYDNPSILNVQLNNLQIIRQRAVNACQLPEMKTRPAVSIIIPVYNKINLTRECIRSLYKNTPCNIDFEVIVIDNASTDGTNSYLKFAENIFDNFTVIRNSENVGFAKSNNLGVKHAKGNYVLFLNNDTEPHPGWLQNLYKIVAGDRNVAAVGSKLLFPDGSLQHAGVVIIEDKKLPDPLVARHIYWKASPDIAEANKLKTYHALTGACLMVRKKAFDEVNGFDEEYWNGYEDVDLCFKLGNLGYKLVYQPDSIVVHHESQSGPERFSKATHNIDRLHQKWIGKIKPDFILEKNGDAIETNAGWIKDYFLPQKQQQNASNIKQDKKSSIVSILALTYNGLEYTEQFIKSIFAYTKSKFELIVIDNGSSDGTLDFLDKITNDIPNIKLIFNSENLGFPKGVNQGLKAAQGKYIVIANNDIVVTEGWLERMIEVAEPDEKIGIVGPVSNAVSGVQLDKSAKYSNIKEMHMHAREIKQNNSGKILEFPRVAFLCTLIKNEVIDKIGGLDERFSPGNYEDDDFCLRAQLAGFKTVIAEDVFIHHYGSKSFAAEGMDEYKKRLETNQKIFFEKWGGTPEEIWLKGKQIKGRNIMITLNKNEFIENVERALSLIKEKDYAYAMQFLKTAVEIYDRYDHEEDDLDLTYLLNLAGNISLLVGNVNNARSYFEKALNIDKSSSLACSGLGDVLFVEGSYEASKTMYEWAVKNNPQNKAAVEGLSKVNKMFNLPEDENSLFNRESESNPSVAEFAEIKPDPGKIIEEAYDLFNGKDFESALDRLSEAENLFNGQLSGPSDKELAVSFHNMKGFVYLGLNENDKARDCFEKALNINPQSSQACAGLGETLFLTGRDEQAKIMYEQAVKNNPGNLFAVGGLQKLNKILGYPEGHSSIDNEADAADDKKISHRDEFGNLFNNLNLSGKGAEIGVQEGVFSKTLRSEWKGEELYLIDRWKYSEDYKDIANVSDEKQKEFYLSVVEKFADDRSVHIIRKDSLAAAEQFPDGYFDWIYLDADHSFEGCSRDLEAWYPKIKTGGILAGHDYLEGVFPGGVFGVKSAVDGFIKNLDVKLYLTDENTIKSWYFIKPSPDRNEMEPQTAGEKTAPGKDDKESEKLQSTLNSILEASFELFGLKYFDESIEKLRKAEDDFYYCNNKELLVAFENLKGFNYLGLNENDNARRSFEKALNINPNSSQACAGLGELFYLNGKEKESKTMYEYAVKNNPDNKFAVDGLEKVNKILGLPVENNSLL